MAVTFDAKNNGNGWHNRFSIAFNSRGMVTNPVPGGPGTIELCRADTDPGRVVNISVVGRPDVDEFTCN